jgi:hypothetical protein
LARPENRQAAIFRLREQAGRKLPNLYFTLGQHDFVVVSEMPDAKAWFAAATLPRLFEQFSCFRYDGYREGTSEMELYTAGTGTGQRAAIALNECGGAVYDACP